MSNPKRVLEALAALAEDGTLTRKASPKPSEPSPFGTDTTCCDADRAKLQ